jgi:HEXXH motif-containing protein
MSDLVEQVTTALRNPGDSPWLPGVATGLADHGWKDLYHNIRLTSSDYGTARVIARDCSAPRKIISVIPAALSDRDSEQVFQIELLSEDTSRRYEESGVKFYFEDEINEEKLSKGIVEAVNILKSLPTLFTTIAELVRSVHLLDAGDDDYDVSFSEPHIPFSIFISVPKVSSITNTLRIAEAIVHEAMHLQLTLIERLVPLVTKTQRRIFSPWRGEYRSVRGVLHALYVFRVVDRFLEALLPVNTYNDGGLEYIQMRREEIYLQINTIRSLKDCSELTVTGASFVRRLIHY